MSDVKQGADAPEYVCDGCEVRAPTPVPQCECGLGVRRAPKPKRDGGIV